MAHFTRRAAVGAFLGLGAIAGGVAVNATMVVPAYAVDVAAAERLVATTSNEILALITSNSSQTAKRRGLAAILRNRFAFTDIARASIGRPWRSMSNAQKRAYQDAFMNYLTKLYVGRFSQYAGQSMNVVSAVDNGQQGVLVRSVVEGGGDRVIVEWRVMDRNGSPEIFDIIVEGVSLVTTQRSEFSSLMDQVGGDVNDFIDRLRQQN